MTSYEKIKTLLDTVGEGYTVVCSFDIGMEFVERSMDKRANEGPDSPLDPYIFSIFMTRHMYGIALVPNHQLEAYVEIAASPAAPMIGEEIPF